MVDCVWTYRGRVARRLPMASRRRGFTVIEVLIVIVVIAIIAAIAIPGLLSSQRSSYERNASTSLKTLCVAEADFKANDRDANKVNDYWTADVKGLYTMTSLITPGKSGGTTDPPLRLIDLTIAAADADGVTAPAGGENMDVTTFAVVATKGGYWYGALVQDGSVPGPDAQYMQDTGGILPMGSVHNTTRYGFITFPDSPSYGKFVFIVNENSAVYRSATSTSVRLGTAVPPGAAGIHAAYRNWPDDAQMKANWSKMD
jgi:prepilin-type N-terminal cleavage/methylation domain-containing protein